MSLIQLLILFVPRLILKLLMLFIPRFILQSISAVMCTLYPFTLVDLVQEVLYWVQELIYLVQELFFFIFCIYNYFKKDGPRQGNWEADRSTRKAKALLRRNLKAIKRHFPILDPRLPAEVRLMIYDFILQLTKSSKKAYVYKHNCISGLEPKRHPLALLLANRRIYREACHLVYPATQFVATRPVNLTRFLSNIRSINRPLIQKLELSFHFRTLIRIFAMTTLWGEPTPIQKMLLALNLKELYITLMDPAVIFDDDENSDRCYMLYSKWVLKVVMETMEGSGVRVKWNGEAVVGENARALDRVVEGKSKTQFDATARL